MKKRKMYTKEQVIELLEFSKVNEFDIKNFDGKLLHSFSSRIIGRGKVQQRTIAVIENFKAFLLIIKESEPIINVTYKSEYGSPVYGPFTIEFKINNNV